MLITYQSISGDKEKENDFANYKSSILIVAKGENGNYVQGNKQFQYYLFQQESFTFMHIVSSALNNIVTPKWLGRLPNLKTSVAKHA